MGATKVRCPDCNEIKGATEMMDRLRVALKESNATNEEMLQTIKQLMLQLDFKRALS